MNGYGWYAECFVRKAKGGVASTKKGDGNAKGYQILYAAWGGLLSIYKTKGLLYARMLAIDR